MLMNLFYTIGIAGYGLLIRFAALFVPKARLWVDGRKHWQQRLAVALGDSDNWIWMHCASLGEFEQGRSLIEAIKADYPDYKVLLTFYSPSGYEIRKNYALADHVCYLPLDLPRNARTFLDIVQPKLIIHVKYDLWLNLIAEAKRRDIHQILISALIKPKSKFLRLPLRGQFRKAFQSFTWIFSQDTATATLLEDFAGMQRISVAGDTRFDRAAQLPSNFEPIPKIESFINGRKCIVVGSVWPKDESIVLPAIQALRRPELCWIIAAHEIHPAAIDQHIAQSGGKMIKYSAEKIPYPEPDILWIDNVGMLSRLYHYAELAYIGGGFGAGIHNTQEPAVYGNPVIFGPNYDKFLEAVDMVAAGNARSVSDTAGLVAAIRFWLDDPVQLAASRAANRAYMQSMTGATESILKKMQLLGLLERV